MESKSKCFEELLVWKKMHNVVLNVYKLTNKFPKSELFGITNQLRRAAVSVSANIVEGYSKISKADKLRFYNIAQGSLEEADYFLLLSKDLGFAETDELRRKVDEVGRMLKGYMHSVSKSLKK